MISSRRKATGKEETHPQARLQGCVSYIAGVLEKQAADHILLPWRRTAMVTVPRSGAVTE